MKFPNNQQVALLLESDPCDLQAIVEAFRRVCEAKYGWKFNVPEVNPGVFYRLFGGASIMATFELIQKPGDPAVFQQALNSNFTGVGCPDVRERLMRHKAMVLVTIGHGVMGGVMSDPKFANLFASVGMRIEGESLPEFLQRLDLAALAARIALDHAPSTLVHWTQSNMLLKPEMFDKMAEMDAPSPLHVHPVLFGTPAGPGEAQALGLRTFGMRHFIGYEVIVEPTALPWAAIWQSTMTVLNVALMPNGYIIPDGDTFGDEDRTQSFRIRHLSADEGGAPLLEMTPLLMREFNFVASDYAPERNVIDDRMPPAELMPTDDGEKMELAKEWREKRALAEGAGARFEVRSFEAPPPRPAPPRANGPPSIRGTRLLSRLFSRGARRRQPGGRPPARRPRSRKAGGCAAFALAGPRPVVRSRARRRPDRRSSLRTPGESPSRPSATPRMAMSRSVMTPASRPASSTGIEPKSSCFIACTTDFRLSPRCAPVGSAIMTSEIAVTDWLLQLER